MTLVALQKKGKYWQDRLRLSDWDIDFKFAHHMDIEAVGRCEYNTHRHTATVSVLLPSENTDPEGFSNNLDVTLVHELLHPILTPLFRREEISDFENAAQEFAVERIAQAIVSGESSVS